MKVQRFKTRDKVRVPMIGAFEKLSSDVGIVTDVSFAEDEYGAIYSVKLANGQSFEFLDNELELISSGPVLDEQDHANLIGLLGYCKRAEVAAIKTAEESRRGPYRDWVIDLARIGLLHERIETLKKVLEVNFPTPEREVSDATPQE